MKAGALGVNVSNRNPYVAYGATRLLAATLAAVIVPLVSRMLGPGDYGRFALAYACAFLVSSLAGYWLSMAIVRFVPGLQVSSIGIYRAVRRIWMMMAPIVAIVAGSIALLFVDYQTAIASAVLAVVQSKYQVDLQLARAMDEFRSYQLLVLSRGGFSLAALGGLFLLSPSTPLLVMCGLGSAIALSLLINRPAARFSTTEVSHSTLAPWQVPAKRWLSYGLPLSVGFVFALIIGFADRMMLFHMDSAATAGMYSAYYDLVTQAVSVSGLVVSTPGQPLVVHALNTSDVRLGRELDSYSRLMTSGVVLSGALVIALWPWIEVLLIGPELRASSGQSLTALLALGGALGVVRAHYTNFRYQLIESTRPIAGLTVAAGSVNVVANAALIPLFGIWGAAVATVVTYVAVVLLPIKHLTRVGAPRGDEAVVLTGILVLSLVAVWVILGMNPLHILAVPVLFGVVVARKEVLHRRSQGSSAPP